MGWMPAACTRRVMLGVRRPEQVGSGRQKSTLATALIPASSPSVIRIRTQGFKGEGVAEVIQQVVVAVEADLMAGVAITDNERRLATRRLPLITNSGEVDDISNG